jgi:hypothetical protein
MPKASIIYPSDIVNRNGNMGWHPKGKRAYRNALRTLYQCLQTYREPRLYHLCFEGQTHRTQMKMLNALIQIADRAGIQCEWFACREVADASKAAHIHAFVLIDAYGVNVWKVFNQFDDGQVAELCARHGVNFAIFSPKDDGLHGNNNYMALPYQGPGNRETPLGRKRLADALVWLSYLGKARSKPTEEEADGQLFPASRPNRKRKLTDSPAASPAAPQPNESEQDESSTTASPETNSIDSPADEEGTDSTSSPCMVGTGQRTGSSEEGTSDEDSSPGPKRYGPPGATTHQGKGIV